MIEPPDLTLARRAAWGLAGVFWFFWIAYEDRGLEALTFVAVVIATASGLTMLNLWVGSEKLPRRKWLLRTGAVGLVAGAAVGPLAALLMLVKLGLHAHPEPDFGPEQFVQTLSRTVYWAALGGLIGAAYGLYVRERRVKALFDLPASLTIKAGKVRRVMAVSEEIVIYVCKRCTASAGEPGKCEYCGGKKVACRPGDDGDPIRRPLVDSDGNVVTRAPIWWLHETIPELVDDED